ncbi:MAG: FG-GAP repeat domain-containing protein [Verrucomicrobiota bacterium]
MHSLSSAPAVLRAAVLAALLPGAGLAAAPGGKKVLHSFRKQQLTDQFWSEGASFGDLNKDGRMDVVSGPFWYAGPDFRERREFAPATRVSKSQRDGKPVEFPGFKGFLGNENDYSDNFFSFTHDFNGDGWTDILVLGFPGAESWWYENPKGAPGHWKRHLALDVTDNESPTFTDLTGDGKPEIVCSSKGRYGWAQPDPKHPTAPWAWHSLSPDKKYHKFTHGLGVGDVNGDGRKDLLEKDGWWEQPASLAGDPEWRFHPQPIGTGGAQMYAYDVNGDGLNDLISSLAAHGFGLAWYEQYREGGEIKFKEHIFVNKEARENRYGVKFSQIHALDLVDMDGDGLKDLVTGKRFWAHGPTGDPEPNSPAVLYWFQLKRDRKAGTVDWVPHRVDDASGTGVEVKAVDYNKDGKPDILVGNKRGVFVFTHEDRKVGAAEWEAAQPKPGQP